MTLWKVLTAHIDGLWLSSYAPDRSSPAFFQQKLMGFFFKPVQLHLELTDLTLKFRRHFFRFFVFSLPSIRKHTGQFIKKFLSPLTDLIRMNSILAGELGHGLLAFQGLQGHPGLKGRIVTLPHVACHLFPPPSCFWQPNMHLVPLSSFWGELIFCTALLSIFLFKNTRSASVPKGIFGEKNLPGVLVVDLSAVPGTGRPV
jgi:hypothetical protein